MALLRFLFTTALCIVQLWQSEAAAVKEFHDWDGLKQDLITTEYSMVDFYASWCSFCVTLAPKYEKAAEIISKGNLKDKVKLIKVQCDDEKLEGGRKPICTANNIQGFPTIFVYKKGIKFDQYRGDRSPEAIVQYIEEAVKTGKPKFAGKQVIDQQICLAKDFKKYVSHKSRREI